MFQPGVAPQHQLQTDAASLAGTGLGGYAPYIDAGWSNIQDRVAIVVLCLRINKMLLIPL